MKIFAETDRLIIRELLPTDVDGMFELDANPEVHKYLGNNPIKNKEQAANNIAFIQQQYIDNGIGRWAIIDKVSGDFVGWTGLKYITELINNKKNYYDIGYRLKQKYWGKGIATESAIASIKYAFTTLNIKEIYAIADCNNEGSNTILKKLGMQFIETFIYEGTEHNWYKLKQEDFKY